MVKRPPIGLDGQPVEEPERPITQAEMLANAPQSDMPYFDRMPKWARVRLAASPFPMRAEYILPHIVMGVIRRDNYETNMRINEQRQREAMRQEDREDGLAIG